MKDMHLHVPLVYETTEKNVSHIHRGCHERLPLSNTSVYNGIFFPMIKAILRRSIQKIITLGGCNAELSPEIQSEIEALENVLAG